MKKSFFARGPKEYDPIDLVYSSNAMQVEKNQSIRGLVTRLKENPILRYFCGFEVLGKVPSESTFSRFLDKLVIWKNLSVCFMTLLLKQKN